MSGPLVGTITTAANNNNNIYCFDYLFDKPFPSTGKGKSITYAGNPIGFLNSKTEPHAPWLSAFTENATIEQVLGGHATPRGVLPYCSPFTVTSSPLNGNTTPGPHRAAISVLP